ncbi:protein mono-ADP-ribosyltransferase PARP14-like, partial [Ostrea edulis]|uniref:protein mono-ADP-ribosyltransferase PARP14-like n=1 Tax=Ostrea edulis TaxID=37623 RepID=UPI0024AFAF21
MQSFIRKCLEKAHEYQYSSLAFPALGTGNLSFPSKVVAEIAKETIEEFEGAHETTTIKTIAFIIYVKDEDTFKVFQDILETKKINEKRESIELTGETLQWLCVYGDKDDVTRTMNELNEYFQAGILKVQKSSLKEPEVQEMIDRGSDVQAELNPNKSVSMMAESDDTKCCLIAKFSDRSLLYESPSLKNITLKTLICPYKKEYEALLIFNSCK